MFADLVSQYREELKRIPILTAMGRVEGTEGPAIRVSGLQGRAQLGDRAMIATAEGNVRAEVIRLMFDHTILLPEGPIEGLKIGALVQLDPPVRFAPDPSWLGRVVDPDGKPLDGRPLRAGEQTRSLYASPPPPHHRRGMGERLGTGLAVFDTLLPLARGQRTGLFAGSGVGKSTLIADLAKGVAADVIVIALVGERGREVRDFVTTTLGPSGMARSVVVAATSDQSPQMRRRCPMAAMAVAEMFRAEGKQVLLLVDSVTRFAEAHREVALASGENAELRGFPPSTAPAIARLCERAGPGIEGEGDITAVFSVLVAGSDMEEPVADMLRGVLDGHVVLDREIAERGRFPAVDLLRSVSRSLPEVASAGENRMINDARALLGAYDRAKLMVQAGLYVEGSDPQIDAACLAEPALDAFIAMRDMASPAASFAQLRLALASVDRPAQSG